MIHKKLCYLFSLSIFIFLLFNSNLNAQEFKILEVSTDEYPVISAKYILTDRFEKKVTDLNKQEVRIIENDSQREVVYLKNPEEKATPLSILLIFDVSGSMKNERTKIAQEAARGLINEVDLQTSEIAVSTFNTEAYLNCDFTHDKKRLLKTIAGIEPLGGTSYNDAFLSELTGGMEIARQGKFKKIIIFMTDGLGDAKSDSIIQLANEEDITIFTTTIELDMPPVLKKISKETGGFSFAQINDPKTSKTIYNKLYYDIIATEYGIMKWVVAEDCEDIHNVSVQTRGLNTNTQFELPVDSIEGLMIMPSSLFIRSQEKDSVATKYIRLASPYKPITITDIISTNPEKIKIENPDYPLEIRPGNSHQLKVNYALKGNDDEVGTVKIYTENCLQRARVDIQYGVPGKIEVIKPALGDVYGAGMDTVIRWRGVSKSQPVALYYRKDTEEWQKIAEASGLSYKWETPLDTSETYQIMAKPADATDYQKKQNVNMLRGFNLLDVSNDGNMFITKDIVGMVYVYQIGKSTPIKTMKNNLSRFIYFSSDDLSLINYGRNSLSITNLFTHDFVTPYFWDQFKVFASNPTLFGDEYLLPAKVTINASDNTTVSHLVTEQSVSFNHDENAPLFASFSAHSPYILLLNRDYSLDIHKISNNKTKRITKKGQLVTKAYISPNGKYIYTEQSNWKGIIESNRGKPIINLENQNYIRFSPDGNRLLTIDTLNQLTLWDLKDEETLIKLPKGRYFNFSFNGKMFYNEINNKVTLFDIAKKQIASTVKVNDLRDISITPDGSNIIVTANGEAYLYNCYSGGRVGEVKNPSSPITKAVFAGQNKIITIGKDRSISVWEPSMSPETGISGNFSIISPLPDVTPEYDIGVEIVNQEKEVILENFVANNAEFPIKILQYEWGNFPNEYALVSNPPPFTLLPGETKNIEIRFSPTDTMEFPTSITVVTPGGDVQSRITGSGINKKYALPNKIVDFGKIELNSKKDTTVILLKNISNDIIEIKEIRNSGPDKEQFSMLTSMNKLSLKPGEVLEAKIRYHAMQSGRTSGGLKISVDEQIVSVQLFGEGLGARQVIIRGTTIDPDSNAIQSNVICADIEKEMVLLNQLSDTLGRFNISVFTEGSFILFAEKEGYISASENLDITQPFIKDTIEVTIMFSQVEQGSLFRLNGVFFEFAKAELIPSSKTDLDRVVQLLQRDKTINIEIHGHTDEIGTDESNMILSKARANAVKNYLIENGISGGRLSIQYFGETKPVATNETDEGRQQNRRVEFLIVD